MANILVIANFRVKDKTRTVIYIGKGIISAFCHMLCSPLRGCYMRLLCLSKRFNMYGIRALPLIVICDFGEIYSIWGRYLSTCIYERIQHESFWANCYGPNSVHPLSAEICLIDEPYFGINLGRTIIYMYNKYMF